MSRLGFLLCIPESIAIKWWRLAERMGHAIEMVSEEEKSWEVKKMRERFSITEDEEVAYIRDNYSASLLMEYFTLHVSVIKDVLTDFSDDSQLWWVEAYFARRINADGKLVAVEKQMPILALNSLLWSFESSMCCRSESPGQLWVGPGNAGTHWREAFSDFGAVSGGDDLGTLIETRNDTGFPCGRVGTRMSGFRVFCGPAFFPTSADEGSYVAILPSALRRIAFSVGSLNQAAAASGCIPVNATGQPYRGYLNPRRKVI